MFKRILLSLAFALLLAVPALAVSQGDTLGSFGVVEAEEHALAPGVTELALTVNLPSGDGQERLHVLLVDPSEPTVSLRAGYRNNSTDEWGMQRCTEQSAAMEAALRQTDPAATVIGCVNANFYNMNTGEPTGAFAMNGKIVDQSIDGYHWFCVRRDGSAAVLPGEQRLDNTVREAVGGMNRLIENGRLLEQSGGYLTDPQPRTAVGTCADGTVVIVEVDGRQRPESCGMTCDKLGEILLALGCTDAVNLDGGGSSTFLSRRPGEGLTMKNRSSDGAERCVSATLMVVSDAPYEAAQENAPCDHDWVRSGDAVRCGRCGETRVLSSFTGIYRDGEASRCAILGAQQTGWLVWGDEMLHAGADGALHSVKTTHTYRCTLYDQSGRKRYDFISGRCACGEKFTGSAMWPAGHVWDENHVCTVCGTQGKDVSLLKPTGVAQRYRFTGGAIRPKPKLSDGEYQLVLSNSVTAARDGLLSWHSYDAPGIAAVEIQGCGDYYGHIRIEYEIYDPSAVPTPTPDPTPTESAPPTAPTVPTLPCAGGSDCPGTVFADMPPKDHWAHDAIDWALVRGITNGTSETLFSPDAPCTRAQVVTFLWRAAGSPAPQSADCPFTDVERNFAYDAICWAAEQAITTGTSETTFSPGAVCTRAQVVTFLRRALGNPAPQSADCSFTDVERNFAYDAICWAAGQGITAGTSETTFSPNAACTRAHVVTFLFRASAVK